ncbi:MAG: TMEM143 family protein [Hyphomicrobiaceae bacterium]
MSAVVVLAPTASDDRSHRPAAPATPTHAGTAPANSAPLTSSADTAQGVIEEILAQADAREKFIPVTRAALMERLTRPQSWRGQQATEARRFFRYLDYWRQAGYSAHLIEMNQTYEPFNPDSDLLITRRYTKAEKTTLQARLLEQTQMLLEQANYTRIDPSDVKLILTSDSHYGLDLQVDMHAFDELLIYYRGASKRRYSRRDARKLYLFKEEYDVPIFQRLLVLFKLKPIDLRIREVMRERGCDRKAAEKIVRKLRGSLASEINSDSIYLKLFKNIPRSDLEMCFPNTAVRFRLFDKLRLGVTAGGGFGMGVVGTATKLAVAANPVALAGAAMTLGGLAFRQGMKFIHKRNEYMVTMAQNLYFHALADNRGVMTVLADRASEEDIKEEMLLYSVLAKEPVHVNELRDIDAAIEQQLLNTFGVNVNFDLDDALARLKRDGIVVEQPDGWIRTMPPADAARHIDMLWDSYLDHLPDPAHGEGVEFEDEPLD